MHCCLWLTRMRPFAAVEKSPYQNTGDQVVPVGYMYCMFEASSCFCASKVKRGKIEQLHASRQRSVVPDATARLLNCSVLPRVSVTRSHHAVQALNGVMADGPFALNPDGSAQDPKAFQQGIRNDQSKLDMLRDEPDTLKIILGEDVQAMQQLLRSTHQVYKFMLRKLVPTRCSCCVLAQAVEARRKSKQKSLAERTIDAQRVDATVPRYLCTCM